jgi:hypothetical protein
MELLAPTSKIKHRETCSSYAQNTQRMLSIALHLTHCCILLLSSLQAASLDRHYGRIRQERHADIIAAAPEPEPIQPPSTVHAAAAAGSRRTVLFNIIRSRSARRQRLEVWLQQQVSWCAWATPDLSWCTK